MPVFGAGAVATCIGTKAFALACVGTKALAVSSGVTTAAASAVRRTRQPHWTASEEAEVTAAHGLGAEEAVEVGGRGAVDRPQMRVGGEPKAVRKWVLKTKLHFGGVLNDTPADRIVARRWLAEQMKAEDMRDCDASQLIPVVVALACTPDLDELRGAIMARTMTAALFREAVQCPKA